MENNFSSLLLQSDGLRVGAREVEIDVRLPWYRALPVSVVDVARLSIDGCPIERSDIRFRVNGKSFALDELADRVDEFWFVLDRAVLHATVPHLKPAARHEVELQLDLYPPYIPHLKWVTRAKRSLTAQDASKEPR